MKRIVFVEDCEVFTSQFSIERKQVHGVIPSLQQIYEGLRIYRQEEVRVKGMFTHHTAMLQVKVAVYAIALQIRINSDITQKLHHEHKMKIGIAILKSIEKRK